MAKKLDDMIAPADQARIVEAIRLAELKSSGEIRVHIEEKCPAEDVFQRAVELFEKLGMTATRERNGVLIYVAVGDRKFTILGDKGIHEEVGATFWQAAVEKMTASFRNGAFGEGVVSAVGAVGERLAERFPRRADDVDELPNKISTSDE